MLLAKVKVNLAATHVFIPDSDKTKREKQIRVILQDHDILQTYPITTITVYFWLICLHKKTLI